MSQFQCNPYTLLTCQSVLCKMSSKRQCLLPIYCNFSRCVSRSRHGMWDDWGVRYPYYHEVSTYLIHRKLHLSGLAFFHTAATIQDYRARGLRPKPLLAIIPTLLRRLATESKSQKECFQENTSFICMYCRHRKLLFSFWSNFPAVRRLERGIQRAPNFGFTEGI